MIKAAFFWSEKRNYPELLPTTMANSTQPEKQQDFEIVETNETVASGQNLKAKLLHHLVSVSSVLQKNNSSNDAATEELTKKNTGLISELLLNSSNVPAATNPLQSLVVWKEVLQKLLENNVDTQVDLADESLKKFANQNSVWNRSAALRKSTH